MVPPSAYHTCCIVRRGDTTQTLVRGLDEVTSEMRILLADDHPVVLKGLRTLLENQPGWEVCGEAVDGQEATVKAGQLHPDVVVLDLSMPRLNGLEAARRILGANESAEILVLTVHDSEEMVRKALSIGVHGYVLKSDAGDELVIAIKTLWQHKTFLSRRLSKSLGQDPGNPSPHDFPALSPREREILQLLAEGRSTKQIATELSITVKTTETHRTNIMRKLGIHSTSDLVRYAIRNNIVQP